MVSRNRGAQASKIKMIFSSTIQVSILNISYLDPTRKARPHHWQHHKLGKLYLEDVEADPAAFIYVWMVHRGGEPSVGQLFMVSLVGTL